MSFAQANFPGETSVLDGGQRRRAGAAVVPADGDDVGSRFSDASGDNADSGAGDELYANARARIDGTEGVNQLRELLNTVNVVMPRRRNQRSAWRGTAGAAHV